MALGLSDYQFAYRGITFGKGYAIAPEKIDGLDDLKIRSGDSPIPRGSGNIPGLHTVNAREVTLSLFVTGAKRSQTLADSISEVFAAFTQTDEDYPLTFKEPGMPERRLWVRTVGRKRKRNPSTTHGREAVVLRLRANDPLIYSEDEYGTNLTPYDSAGGGIDYDFDYGIDFTIDTSAEAVLNNAGDANVFLFIRFYGPDSSTTTGVQLTNSTTGQVLDIDTSIINGQVLTADMRRIVTADPEDTPYIHLDGSSRYGSWQLPRDPFYLAPGDNVIRFEVAGTSTGVVCNVTHRDAWL